MSLFKNESPNLGPYTTYTGLSGSSSVLYQSRILTLSPISASAIQGYWLYENGAGSLSTETEIVTQITVDYAVAGPSGLTMAVRKITAPATAPTAAAGATVIELLTTPFTLDSTANTMQTGSLVTSASALTILPGNKIGVSISSATQTGLTAMIVQVYLKKLTPGL